jgi:hypothetical protein
MLSRLQIMLGLALLFSTLIPVSAFAKGGFDFISITGPNLNDVRITDPALTEDFFTFADFYEARTRAPADPGEGYEVLRYYVDGNGAIAFDRLHYYPQSGFVFYDGIENGESEYDGGWYVANPEIKPVFESALALQAATVAPVEEQKPGQSQLNNTSSQSQPFELLSQSLPVIITVAATGLTTLLVFAFGRRKPSAR